MHTVHTVSATVFINTVLSDENSHQQQDSDTKIQNSSLRMAGTLHLRSPCYLHSFRWHTSTYFNIFADMQYRKFPTRGYV